MVTEGRQIGTESLSGTGQPQRRSYSSGPRILTPFMTVEICHRAIA